MTPRVHAYRPDAETAPAPQLGQQPDESLAEIGSGSETGSTDIVAA